MTANSLGMTVEEADKLFRGSTEMRDYDRERVDLLHENLVEILRRLDEQVKDHEKRIRATEQFDWKLTGVIAVAAALGWSVIKGLLIK